MTAVKIYKYRQASWILPLWGVSTKGKERKDLCFLDCGGLISSVP
jgi:hypothetical protein